MMQYYKSVLLYGFAIFAMFFGSGNLVFPLQIGFSGENHWLIGFAGLFLTGIILPLMGLFVIKFYQGSYQDFFAEAGAKAGVILPFILFCLLGSFGVVPRCITVSFGSIHYFFPQVKIIPFSLIFCISTYFLCLNDRLMVRLLGKWMSPILLVTLIIIIIMAIIKAPEVDGVTTSAHAFHNGFLIGYQTMDLFASFFFSALIFQQIQAQFPHAAPRDVMRFAIAPSIIGAFLIALIYVGLVYLGAHYTHALNNTAPELMLPAVAFAAMGKNATFFLSMTIFFSCITTAVALNNLFARYICNLFKLPSSYFPAVLALATIIAFAISLLDFQGIAAFLVPILQIAYPALIVLTVFCLFSRKHKRLKVMAFYGVIILVAFVSLKHINLA